MRDIELYKAILGRTPPWTVVDVTLDVQGQHVTIRVQVGEGPFPCPECRIVVPGYDKKLRRWRHLDTCQFTTWIEAEVPRVQCPTHGVKQLPVPWAEPGSQFTALFERFAIDLLRECAVQGGADLLRITWDEAWGIKARAGARGFARRGHEVVVHLGVDEKAIAVGVTLTGEKVILGFVQTATENEKVCSAFPRELLDCGLRVAQRLLCVLDGAKGLRKKGDPDRLRPLRAGAALSVA